MNNEIEFLKKQNRKLFAQNGELQERVKNLESCMLNVMNVLIDANPTVGSISVLSDRVLMNETVRRYNPQRKLDL